MARLAPHVRPLSLDPVALIPALFDSVLPAFGGPPAGGGFSWPSAVYRPSRVRAPWSARNHRPHEVSSCGRTLAAPPPLLTPALGGCGAVATGADGSRVPRVRLPRSFNQGVEQRLRQADVLHPADPVHVESGRRAWSTTPQCPRPCASGPLETSLFMSPAISRAKWSRNSQSGCRRD